MSIVSNHYPEVLDSPARMPEAEDLPEPTGAPARPLCPVAALTNYEAAYLTFIGYVEAVARDLAYGMNARKAAEALLTRAEQQMALHRAWTAAKWGR